MSKRNESLTEAYSGQNQRLGSAGSNIKVNSVRNDAQLNQEKTPHISVSHTLWLHFVLLLNMCVFFLNSVEVTFSINSRGMYIFLKEEIESGIQSIEVELSNII